VGSYRTDQAAAVTMAHAAGLTMEAKHGPLTKAARAASLDVTAHTAADRVRVARRRKAHAPKRLGIGL
jgi:hypothetical protein